MAECPRHSVPSGAGVSLLFALIAAMIILPGASWAVPPAPGGHLLLFYGGSNLGSYPPLSPVGVEALDLTPRMGFRVAVAPSPSAGRTGIRLTLPRGQSAQVSIFDVRGRLLKRLTTTGEAGPVTIVTWDGRDRHGRDVGSGVYFIRAEAGSQVRTARVVILR